MNESVIDLLKSMIATPSFSREEGAVADIIEKYFLSLEVKSNRHGNNLWVKNTYFDSKKETILLNSHIDTVKPSSSYSVDPFTPTIQDGKLYGLGSNDAGGSLVSLLSTFMHFKDRTDLRFNLVFAASAEEEVSGVNGIESLLPIFATEIGAIMGAIVGEPTSMQMAVAEKGLLVLDCQALGRAGHAAREEGDNAIYKALNDIVWFRDFRFDQVSPLLGPNKMSVTIVNAGTQHNVVPRECNFTVDVRVNELYDFETVLSQIRSKVTCEVKPRSTRIKSTSISMDHPLVKAGLSLGLPHYGSPTTSDKALMPFPALKIGPGDSSRSHTADEFIFLDQIKEGIEIYISLLEKVLVS